MMNRCRGIRCITLGRMSVVFALSTYLLLTGQARAALPSVPMVVSGSENTISLGTNTVSPDALGVTSGGGSGTGTGVVCWSSFGQPFPGRGYTSDVIAELETAASTAYNTGAAFLSDVNTYKLGNVAEGDLDDLAGKYDRETLAAAEAAYRRLQYIDPYNPDYVSGILLVRQAHALKQDLVWDIKRNLQLRKRLTDNAPENTYNGRILAEEIAILANIADLQWESNACVLELFSDSQFRGAGALLRREYALTDNKVVDDTLELVFNGTRRYLEGELERAKKLLLLNFFAEGSKTATNTREYAVEVLLTAEAYATEVLRLVNPYLPQPPAPEDIFDVDYLYDTTDLVRITGLCTEMSELSSLIQQGYNAFGFLPDFVPFLTGASSNDNLSTYRTLVDLAVNACLQAGAIENGVEDDEQVLAQSAEEYETRMQEIESSYVQRLITLVGSVTVTTPNGSASLPDLFTYMMPDIDLDNDGLTERDKARLDFVDEWPAYSFGSKGTLTGQYDIIGGAEDRVTMAFNEIKTNYALIEDEEYTAQRILDIYEEMYTLVMDTGERVGAMIREKGRLQHIAAVEAGRVQRDSNVWKWVWDKGGKKAMDAYMEYSIPGRIYTAVDDWFKRGQLSAVEDDADGATILKAREKNPVAIAGLAIAAVGLVSGVGQSFLSGDAAFKIGEIQGQLAEDLANIDAAIAEQQALQQAELIRYQGEIELERSQQRVRQLVMQQANLELDYAMAVRDATREKKTLATMLDETARIVFDFNRAVKLTEDIGGEALGWQEQDVREVLTNDMLVAEQAFYRAQVWTFIALRALEYYANRPPESNGQPNDMVRGFYRRLYGARRAQDLVGPSPAAVGGLLGAMNTAAESDFVFDMTSTSCPERGLLSLKYDVVVPTLAQSYDDEGNATPQAGGFTYRDPVDGREYGGAQAYQAAFRTFLRESFSGASPLRKLEITFGTHLMPPLTTENLTGDNPFYVGSARNAKIVGFQNTDCLGQGVTPNVQGVQVNITGDTTFYPRIQLQMAGNSYLRHSVWGPGDFDGEGHLIDPMSAINVYSSYQQILPSWLSEDIGVKAAEPPTTEKEDDDCPEGCDCIGSDVVAVFTALVNSDGPSGSSPKTLAFTDRAVANDRWILSINEWETTANRNFLAGLEAMLNSPMPEDPSEDFATDIQIWMGWAYRNP